MNTSIRRLRPLLFALLLASGLGGCDEPARRSATDARPNLDGQGGGAPDGPASGPDGAGHDIADAQASRPDSAKDGPPSQADGHSSARVAEQYPYDPMKFAFKQEIPPGVPDDPRSAAIVARLDLNSSLVKVGLSDDGEVPPIYVVGPGDPTYSLTVSGGTATTFRVPAGAVPGSGSDFPLVLLDPMHPTWGAATELRLWQAQIDTGTKTLSASGSGLFHYNNDGKILNADGTPSIAVPFKGWGTGCGLSILAGLIRPDEVSNGKIEHALRFAYSSCNSTSTFRPPATKTDQPKGCSTVDPPSAMEMGMRLQLDPGLDCNSRTVPGKADTSKETRFLRIICRALQEYGMIMVDGTVDKGLLLMMENKATASWQAIVGAELYGSYGYLVRDQDSPSDGLTRGPSDGIPWHKLRVLAKSVF